MFIFHSFSHSGIYTYIYFFSFLHIYLYSFLQSVFVYEIIVDGGVLHTFISSIFLPSCLSISIFVCQIVSLSIFLLPFMALASLLWTVCQARSKSLFRSRCPECYHKIPLFCVHILGRAKTFKDIFRRPNSTYCHGLPILKIFFCHKQPVQMTHRSKVIDK
mgnify:CR=1 FL=1